MGVLEDLIIRTVIYIFATVIGIYIECQIVKYLIKFGIDYFSEKKYQEWAYSPQNEEYQTIRLNHEELYQISFALNTRIESIKETIREANGTDAVGILGKELETCISAQKQTTYAGQPEKYKYREDR